MKITGAYHWSAAAPELDRPNQAAFVVTFKDDPTNAEAEALRKLLEQGVVRIRQAIHYQTWPGAQNWVSDVEEHLAGSHSVGSATLSGETK